MESRLSISDYIRLVVHAVFHPRLVRQGQHLVSQIDAIQAASELAENLPEHMRNSFVTGYKTGILHWGEGRAVPERSAEEYLDQRMKALGYEKA